MPSFPRFEMPDLKVPELKLPEFTLPDFKLPELPTFELPEVDLPTADQIAAFARDAAYVGVGLAVMTAERARELVGKVAETVSR